jgi:hypothetical protein
MGIFGAKRARFTDTYQTWTACFAEPVVARSSDMEDDDLIVGARAYGARFDSPSAPGAALSIWAYPAPAGPGTPDGTIVLAYRVHYSVGSWGTALYHCDVACGEWYDNLPAAEADAVRFIAGLISSGPHTDRVPDFYTDWDGRRF